MFESIRNVLRFSPLTPGSVSFEASIFVPMLVTSSVFYDFKHIHVRTHTHIYKSTQKENFKNFNSKLPLGDRNELDSHW